MQESFEYNINVPKKPSNSEINREFRFNQALRNTRLSLDMNMFSRNKQLIDNHKKIAKSTKHISLDETATESAEIDLKSNSLSNSVTLQEDIPFIDENIDDYSPEEQVVQKIKYLKLRDQISSNKKKKIVNFKTDDNDTLANNNNNRNLEQKTDIGNVQNAKLYQTKHDQNLSEDCLSVFFPKNKSKYAASDISKLNELSLKLDLSCLNDSDSSDNSSNCQTADKTNDHNENNDDIHALPKIIDNPLESSSNCKFCKSSITNLKTEQNQASANKTTSTQNLTQYKNELSSEEKELILMQLEEWSKYGVLGQNIYGKNICKKLEMKDYLKRDNNAEENRIKKYYDRDHDTTINIYAVNNFCDNRIDKLRGYRDLDYNTVSRKSISTPCLPKNVDIKQKFPYAYLVKKPSKTFSASCPNVVDQNKSAILSLHDSKCSSQKYVKSAPSLLKIKKIKHKHLDQKSTPRYEWFEFKNHEKELEFSGFPCTSEAT